MLNKLFLLIYCQMTWQTVYHKRCKLADNKRTCVVYKFLRNIGAVFGNPFLRHSFFQRLQYRLYREFR